METFQIALVDSINMSIAGIYREKGRSHHVVFIENYFFFHFLCLFSFVLCCLLFYYEQIIIYLNENMINLKLKLNLYTWDIIY